MIRNSTARALLYSWHSGQGSPFYQAASSGLVRSWYSLLSECARIDAPDRERLNEWLEHRQRTRHTEVYVLGVWHGVLPWVSRTYYD